MNALLVRGLSRSQLVTRLRRGDITKIARGIYVWGAPTPLEVLRAVQEYNATVLAAGRTAAQLYLGHELTTPLELRGPARLPTSPFYSLRRTKQNAYRMIDGIRVANPLLAIERDRAEFRRLSAHAQKVLTQAALFTDSSAEILVIRALKARGLKVESNYLIGAYRWDIVLPDYKIAIEINGLQFHSALKPWIRDHWKNNEAVLRGWRTLRYTGHCVKYHLNYIVEQICTADQPDWERRYYRGVRSWHRALGPAPWEGALEPPPEPDWVRGHRLFSAGAAVSGLSVAFAAAADLHNWICITDNEALLLASKSALVGNYADPWWRPRVKADRHCKVAGKWPSK